MCFLFFFSLNSWRYKTGRRADELMSGFDDKSKVHSLLIVCRLSSQTQLSIYLRFINCYGKTNREMHVLAQWHMIGHRLFVSEPIRNIFYLCAAIFEIPPACWGEHVLIDIYQLPLFSIISPCWILKCTDSKTCLFITFAVLFLTIHNYFWSIWIIHLGPLWAMNLLCLLSNDSNGI